MKKKVVARSHEANVIPAIYGSIVTNFGQVILV